MTDQPPKPPVVPAELTAIASANAPFIFFDVVGTVGFNSGIASITLEAVRHVAMAGQVLQDRVAVGHLRMGPAGLQSLKSAIEGIEQLAKRHLTDQQIAREPRA